MSLAFERSPQPPSTRFANFSLGLDAAFCNIAGLILTLGGGFMADWLGTRGWIVTLFGVLVLLWSFVVTLFANRRVTLRPELDLVLRVNVVSAVVFALIAGLTGWLSGPGRVGLAVFAGVFALFAVAQFMARSRLAV